MKNILSQVHYAFLALSVMSLSACFELEVVHNPADDSTGSSEVTLTFPVDGHTEVPLDIDAIRITINNIDESLITASNISITPDLSGTISIIGDSEILFAPVAVMDANTSYTITVSGLLTSSGESVEPVSWSFTTASVVVPGPVPVPNPEPEPVSSLDCTLSTVLCVDDTAGANQEYSNIQAAIDVSQAGDTVLVFSGNYDGFRVDKSGSADQPIKVVSAAADVYITGSEPYGNNAIRIDNASYITVQGFNITRTSVSSTGSYNDACVAARGASVSAPMQSLSFINNHLNGCSPAGMYLSNVNNLLIKRNTVENSNDGTTNFKGMGFYIANAAAKNATIIENKIMNNSGSGIHFNGDSSVGGDGVQSGHMIKNNFIIGNGVNGFNMDGVNNSEVVNNVFAQNGRHGMRGYRIDGASGPQSLKIINNTFYSNGSSAVKMSEDLGGHVVFNNIVIDNVENNFVIDAANMAASNNLISTDEVSVFVSAAGNDFRLNGAASAVNGGVSSLLGVNAPSTDLSENIRSGAPDIGAFESGSEYPAWY